MPYLPPGWTEERLRTVTKDDLRQMPQEKLCEIDEDLIPIANVEVRIILGRARRNEQQRLQRETSGLPPIPPKDIFREPDDQVVELVERAGFDDFGFIVFKTYYSDEEKWGEWDKEWTRRVDAAIERCQGGSKIEDKLSMPTYENEELQDANFQQIQQEFLEYYEEGNVPLGLDHGVCLVVDKEAMDSMASDEPWVYAMDMTFDHSVFVPDGEYPGYFRVAVDSVITDLYPTMAMLGPGLRQLWHQDDRIWVHPFQTMFEPS